MASAKKFPVLTLTGPRQSGKTTLAKNCFPKLPYVSLEAPDIRRHATEDPRDFLYQYRHGAVIDEAQHAADLFSYLQVHVDETKLNGRFVLTGSQNFLLLEKISQSLAGRVAIHHLLPLTLKELTSYQPIKSDYLSYIQNGFYPRLYDQNIAATDWIPHYLDTYVERDVRQLVNVRDTNLFHNFLRLCAGRVGQLLNLNALGNDLGVDQTTIKRWMNVLESSFIVFRLPPYHRNIKKRLIKSAKLYFYDTAVPCQLLGIRSAEDLVSHFARGPLFENFIIADLLKKNFHSGRRADASFYRDSNGNEIDYLEEAGTVMIAHEIKSARTVNSSMVGYLPKAPTLFSEHQVLSKVIYGGNSPSRVRGIDVKPWTMLADPQNDRST